MSARRRPAAVLLAALAVLAAGCGDGAKEGGTADSAPAAPAPSAVAADRALTYMRAVVADDWTTACSLMSPGRRAACHDRHTAPPEPETDGPAIGPVILDRAPTRAIATSDYPAGWAVIAAYTVTWPGKPATTSRVALRMTEDSGAWWVEQREDVADSDLTWSDDPARSALGREVG
ncbi:hypothetical protein [Streptomyces sp. NBC_01264]|uniref:hypothetical protein n=1 Tax=Streptomyces sp. NBC_01264 TaxID=2903804 RepID=UPI0022554A47|nr:hypothetical protein [Streptomyces sp. NBC_01264]MCX4784629.1 hypothetical protein [Streptomyces sp. NBC_01264]